MTKDIETERLVGEIPGQFSTVCVRKGRPENGIYYQHELIVAAMQNHLWDPAVNKRADLRGRSFFVSVGEDGLSVKVVEE